MYNVVKIETHDGRLLEGAVISFESGILSESGFEELAIDYKTHHEVVDESEIKSITVLSN